MKKMLKTINRHNGNLCFVGAKDDGDTVLECDRNSGSVFKASSSQFIHGLCHAKDEIYFLSFANGVLGSFKNGSLNESYLDTGLNRIDEIVGRKDQVFYTLNTVTAQIHRFTLNPFSIDWSIVVTNPFTFAQRNGHLIVKEADDSLIYYDNEQAVLIKDGISSASIANRMAISEGEKTIIESQWDSSPSAPFFRWKQVGGESIEQSSSSSFSSSSSSNSSSSSANG